MPRLVASNFVQWLQANGCIGRLGLCREAGYESAFGGNGAIEMYLGGYSTLLLSTLMYVRHL